MTRRARNRLCILTIFLGLGNFLVYTATYAWIGGDAFNGQVRDGVYYVRGHHLRVPGGELREVPRGVWIYSYLHSMSIAPTAAAVIVALLILARPHIIATMREDALVGGSAFVTASITITVVLAGFLTLWRLLDFFRQIGTGLVGAGLAVAGLAAAGVAAVVIARRWRHPSGAAVPEADRLA